MNTDMAFSDIVVARAPVMTPAGLIPSPFTTALIASIVTFVVLATGAVTLRVYTARKYAGSTWKTLDLWLIIAALVVTWGIIIATICGAAVVGLNYIDDRQSLDLQSQFAFKVLFSDTITQTTASGLVKLSVLEFYERIFITRDFRIICNIMSFLIVCWIVGTFFTQLFSTTPISSGWHADRQLKDANYDYPTAFLAIFGIGMVLDVLVLSLPIRPIYKLQLEWRRKIKIYLILLLGIFCVICASVRFYYSYRQLRAVFDATAAQKGTITVDAQLWSILEPSASIIAACLPTYGPLIKGRNLTSMVRSARSFLSISSHSHRSHSRSTGDSGGSPSREKDSASDHHDPMSDSWNRNQLRPDARTHKTDVEANLTKVSTPPRDSYIHATTEVTVTRHGESP